MKRRGWRDGMVVAAALASILASGFVATSAGAAAGVPSVPRGVHASGTATSISVKWVRPASVGSTPIREYVVTSKPLAKSCATKMTTCVVKGLAKDRSYTFSVVAKNSNGNSLPARSDRVKVAKAGVYFRTRLNVFESTSAVAESALDAARTTSKERKALTALNDSFESLIASLKLEQWPSTAAVNMAKLLTDTRVLATDSIAPFEESSSNPAAGYDVLQSATNKELLAEAYVYINLGFASPIISTIATTPTPVSLNTVQTIHDFYGDPVSVAATGIVDPATAAPGSGLPDSGYRFVAVEVNLNNSTAGTTIYGDANFSTTVTGSDGQTYAADFGTVSQCSNFEAGDFQLSPNGSAAGCVVFELPNSVTVKSIQFSLAPNYLDTAEWNS